MDWMGDGGERAVAAETSAMDVLKCQSRPVGIQIIRLPRRDEVCVLCCVSWEFGPSFWSLLDALTSVRWFGRSHL